MAKVKTEEIYLKTGDKVEKFKYDINVDSKGNFYVNFPDDLADRFNKAGVRGLILNPRTEKYCKISVKTLDELEKSIAEMKRLYESYKVIGTKIVFRYKIITKCTYIKDETGIYPNGNFIKDYHDLNWKSGTENVSATWPITFGFDFYAKPYKEVTVEYINGIQKQFYERLDDEDKKDDENLRYVDGIIGQAEPSGIQLIDYTPDVARFFCGLFKSLFNLNESIKDFLNPDGIKFLSEQGVKVLSQ